MYGCPSLCSAFLASMSLRNCTSVHFKVPRSTHAFVFHRGAAQKPRLIEKQKQNRRKEKKKPLSENLVFTASSHVSLHLLRRSEDDKAARRRWQRSNQRAAVWTHVSSKWRRQMDFSQCLGECPNIVSSENISKVWDKMAKWQQPLLVVCHWKCFYLAAPTAGLLCNTALVTETYFFLLTRTQQHWTEKMLMHSWKHLHIF